MSCRDKIQNWASFLFSHLILSNRASFSVIYFQMGRHNEILIAHWYAQLISHLYTSLQESGKFSQAFREISAIPLILSKYVV